MKRKFYTSAGCIPVKKDEGYKRCDIGTQKTFIIDGKARVFKLETIEDGFFSFSETEGTEVWNEVT
jgi:hypothetical protein